jgi:UDP-glucose 4-epimerase
MSILVTGGAGYIGSHAIKQLIQQGYDVVAIDNLSRGHRQAVDRQARFRNVSLLDMDEVLAVFYEYQIDCVMHFAGWIVVNESITDPLTYYENNVADTIVLLQAMKTVDCKQLVFSSSAAVYGEPNGIPDENAPCHPINPYGRSKWFIEQILRDCVASDPTFRYAALRYFNVAGATADGSLGEAHNPETHLIPLLLQAVVNQLPITIFGTDYPTSDGTCIRDYIHVDDLCNAHIRVMKALQPGGQVFNLGIGHGYSNREVIEAVQQVTGEKVPLRFGSRRSGDPAILFANAQKIRQLGWEPTYTDLQSIVATAWNWMQNHPHGYDI